MSSDRKSTPLVASALACALASIPSAAYAYCQSTTAPISPACPSPCPTTGLPLAWRTPEIEYAFNRNAFVGADGPQLRAAIVRSFQHWADVTCSGQPIGFTFAQSAQDTDLTLAPNQNQPNVNVITQVSASQWGALGLDSHTFAKTQLWFDTKTGEIVVAEVAFNGSIGAFTACPSTGCPTDAIDLENVTTHELGHFLGLAHSADQSATMWCDAVKGDIQKRSLAPDDEAGLCGIYGSRTVFLDPGAAADRAPSSDGSGASVTKASSSGCAVGGTGNPQATLWVLGLFAVLSRRKLQPGR